MCNLKSLYDPAGFMGGGGDQLHAKLGLGVKPQTPDVVATDPEADAAAAQTAATKATNAAAAEKKRRGKASSLLATGGQGDTSSANTSSLLAQGKTLLGA